MQGGASALSALDAAIIAAQEENLSRQGFPKMHCQNQIFSEFLSGPQTCATPQGSATQSIAASDLDEDAEAFGWRNRSAKLGTMQDGNRLVGVGCKSENNPRPVGMGQVAWLGNATMSASLWKLPMGQKC